MLELKIKLLDVKKTWILNVQNVNVTVYSSGRYSKMAHVTFVRNVLFMDTSNMHLKSNPT